MTHKLAKKFPHIYKRFVDGSADLEVLRWVTDNAKLFIDDKIVTVTLVETKLVAVDKDGKHYYSEI